MRKINGTFCIERTTLRRLQGFSKKSGIPQSQLVERMVLEGLNHLERRWRSPDELLQSAFEDLSLPEKRRKRT
jgi:hypothetical protein